MDFFLSAPLKFTPTGESNNLYGLEHQLLPRISEHKVTDDEKNKLPIPHSDKLTIGFPFIPPSNKIPDHSGKMDLKKPNNLIVLENEFIDYIAPADPKEKPTKLPPIDVDDALVSEYRVVPPLNAEQQPGERPATATKDNNIWFDFQFLRPTENRLPPPKDDTKIPYETTIYPGLSYQMLPNQTIEPHAGKTPSNELRHAIALDNQYLILTEENNRLKDQLTKISNETNVEIPLMTEYYVQKPSKVSAHGLDRPVVNTFHGLGFHYMLPEQEARVKSILSSDLKSTKSSKTVRFTCDTAIKSNPLEYQIFEPVSQFQCNESERHIATQTLDNIIVREHELAFGQKLPNLIRAPSRSEGRIDPEKHPLLNGLEYSTNSPDDPKILEPIETTPRKRCLNTFGFEIDGICIEEENKIMRKSPTSVTNIYRRPDPGLEFHYVHPPYQPPEGISIKDSTVLDYNGMEHQILGRPIQENVPIRTKKSEIPHEDRILANPIDFQMVPRIPHSDGVRPSPSTISLNNLIGLDNQVLIPIKEADISPQRGIFTIGPKTSKGKDEIPSPALEYFVPPPAMQKYEPSYLEGELNNLIGAEHQLLLNVDENETIRETPAEPIPPIERGNKKLHLNEYYYNPTENKLQTTETTSSMEHIPPIALDKQFLLPYTENEFKPQPTVVDHHDDPNKNAFSTGGSYFWIPTTEKVIGHPKDHKLDNLRGFDHQIFLDSTDNPPVPPKKLLSNVSLSDVEKTLMNDMGFNFQSQNPVYKCQLGSDLNNLRGKEHQLLFNIKENIYIESKETTVPRPSGTQLIPTVDYVNPPINNQLSKLPTKDFGDLNNLKGRDYQMLLNAIKSERLAEKRPTSIIDYPDDLDKFKPITDFGIHNTKNKNQMTEKPSLYLDNLRGQDYQLLRNVEQNPFIEDTKKTVPYKETDDIIGEYKYVPVRNRLCKKCPYTRDYDEETKKMRTTTDDVERELLAATGYDNGRRRIATKTSALSLEPDTHIFGDLNNLKGFDHQLFINIDAHAPLKQKYPIIDRPSTYCIARPTTEFQVYNYSPECGHILEVEGKLNNLKGYEHQYLLNLKENSNTREKYDKIKVPRPGPGEKQRQNMGSYDILPPFSETEVKLGSALNNLQGFTYQYLLNIEKNANIKKPHQKIESAYEDCEKRKFGMEFQVADPCNKSKFPLIEGKLSHLRGLDHQLLLDVKKNELIRKTVIKEEESWHCNPLVPHDLSWLVPCQRIPTKQSEFKGDLNKITGVDYEILMKLTENDEIQPLPVEHPHLSPSQIKSVFGKEYQQLYAPSPDFQSTLKPNGLDCKKFGIEAELLLPMPPENFAVSPPKEEFPLLETPVIREPFHDFDYHGMTSKTIGKTGIKLDHQLNNLDGRDFQLLTPIEITDQIPQKPSMKTIEHDPEDDFRLPGLDYQYIDIMKRIKSNVEIDTCVKFDKFGLEHNVGTPRIIGIIERPDEKSVVILVKKHKKPKIIEEVKEKVVSPFETHYLNEFINCEPIKAQPIRVPASEYFYYVTPTRHRPAKENQLTALERLQQVNNYEASLGHKELHTTDTETSVDNHNIYKLKSKTAKYDKNKFSLYNPSLYGYKEDRLAIQEADIRKFIKEKLV